MNKVLITFFRKHLFVSWQQETTDYYDNYFCHVHYFLQKVYQGDRQKPPFTDRGPQRKKEKGKPKRFAKSKEWGEHLDTRFKTEVIYKSYDWILPKSVYISFAPLNKKIRNDNEHYSHWIDNKRMYNLNKDYLAIFLR